MKPLKPHDQSGKLVAVGAKIRLVQAPSWFEDEIPKEDVAAIEFIMGKVLKVVGFDVYGHAELEFTDPSGINHSVWVEPNCLSLL